MSTSTYGDELGFRFIQQENGIWITGQMSLQELYTEQIPRPDILIAFLPISISSLVDQGPYKKLMERFKIPPSFGTEAIRLANGYFGCQSHHNNGVLESYNTFFGFVFKQTHNPNNMEIVQYCWHKIRLFISWMSPGTLVVLSFGCSSPVDHSLSISLMKSATKLHLNDPFAICPVIIQEVLELYSESLLGWRNLIRTEEKNRPSLNNPQPNFERMHEIAKHAKHASESLAIAVETMLSMIQEHEIFFDENSSLPKEAHAVSKEIRRTLRFQGTIFKTLHQQSINLEERFRDEINQAFNIVTRYDSRVAQIDSATMRTISVLGMLFLPATFISALFSTSFFNFTPSSDTEPQRWTISERFWVYWVVTLPLTMATVIFWSYWQRVYFG